MERTRHTITTSQFFIMLFVSRVVVTIGLNARFLGGENMLEAIFSYLLAMAAGLVLSLPVWALHRQWPALSVGEAACKAMGGAGRLVSLFYMAYFILLSAGALGLFHIFLREAVNPDFSASLIMAGVLAAAAFGALRGIETVARCAVCVFAILLAGSVLVFGITAFRFDPENLDPLFTQGFSQTMTGFRLFLARTTVFADMAVLLPWVRGKKLRGFLAWAGGTSLFVGLLLLLLAGCLGPYAVTQDFPVFALSALTEIRSMQRVDAVFVGVWMMGLVVKLAYGLYACRACCASLAGKPLPKTAVFSACAVILPAAFAMVKYPAVQWVLLSPGPFLICTLVTALLPLLIQAAAKVRHIF